MAKDSSISKDSRCPHKNLQIEATILPDGRWLLFDKADSSFAVLTPPAGILWELCDGHTPLDQITNNLRQYYPDVTPETLDEEVRRMTNTLIEQGFIQYG